MGNTDNLTSKTSCFLFPLSSWSTDNLMAPTDNLIIRLSMFVQVHWCPELHSFLFAWLREAYNLVSTLKGVRSCVHGSDCHGKLSYSYLGEERGRHLSGHDDCPTARRLVRLGHHEPTSIFLSASRLGQLSQSQSFYFGAEKSEKEKAQTAL